MAALNHWCEDKAATTLGITVKQSPRLLLSIERYELQVEGMSCNEREDGVTNAAERVDVDETMRTTKQGLSKPPLRKTLETASGNQFTTPDTIALPRTTLLLVFETSQPADS